MEMLELIHAAAAALTEDGCPFCNSSKGTKETLDIVSDAEENGHMEQINDPGKLRTNLGGDKRWRIKLEHDKINARMPDDNNKYLLYINGDYFTQNKRDESSRFLEMDVGSNAHHLIPGNASFKKADELLKWMAETVHFKTIRYEPNDAENFPISTAAIDYFLPRGETRSETIIDGPGVETSIQYSRVEASDNIKKEITKRITGGYVSGKIEYDINEPKNGIFLPSNNAIKSWKTVDTRITNFQNMYVKAAIEATNDGGKYCQFHDAHEKYSEQVEIELNALASAVDKVADNCPDGKEHNEDPLPAPQRLKKSLQKISDQLKEKVCGNKSTWSGPFLTSEKSLWAK